MIKARIPILGFAAFSGTGKTTLLVQLLPMLKQKGLRIGMIKHAHHDFDIDTPGKDSYELRKAGADQMLITSKRRWALMVETPNVQDDPDLNHMLQQLDQDRLDLVLVEGFKHVHFPKIELHRPTLGKPLLFPEDDSIIAIATDQAIEQPCKLPKLDLNEPNSIVAFIVDFLAQSE